MSKTNKLIITLPAEFDLGQNIAFLGRSDRESLFTIENGLVLKAFATDGGPAVVSIGLQGDVLEANVLTGKLDAKGEAAVSTYIRDWFDLDNDIRPFYKMAAGDKLLKPLTKKFFGLRLIGIPDLFEALSWAIIGQQINLAFAYTLKQRLVENFGESVKYNDKLYNIFPSPKAVAALRPDDLRPLQFSGKKAEYLIGIAQKFASGELSKEHLLSIESREQQEKLLTSVHGIGKWSAHYAMMKSLKDYSAFPVADVGLQNAVKVLMKVERKPTEKELLQMAKNWKGWEGYATFYLWRSLY